MAAPDLVGILRVPGELIASPTVAGITGAFPYGGTRLGLVQDIVVRINQATTMVRTEEFVSEVVETIEGGRDWKMSAALRSFDRDAIQRVFPTTLIGAETQQRVVTDGGDARAGTRGSARAIPILFAPDDPTRRFAVLFHRAIPVIDPSAALTLDLDQEAMIGVLFQSIRHGTSARLVSWGLIRDIAGRLEAP